MLRLIRRAVPLGILAALAIQTNALAATVNVSMTNFVFTPKLANVQQGSAVLWTNNASSTSHTTTGDTPLSLWDSGSVSPGGTFMFTFTAAGKYTYHCSFHQSLGMVGTVSVPVKANPPSGPQGTQFKIIVASVNAPAGFVYDIQKKDPGGSFQDWMVGLTSRTATFDSTLFAPGTYQFHARLRNTGTGAASLYSAAKSVMVT